MKAQSGFTLLELLLAMSLGVVLISGLITVYISVLHLRGVQEDWIEVQQNGRMAVMLFLNSLKQKNCPHFSVNSFNQQKKPPFLTSQTIVGNGLLINNCTKFALYISKTNRKSKNNHSVYALFIKRENKPRQEYLENISNLNIEFFKKSALLYFQFTLLSADNKLKRKWRLVSLI